MATTCLTGTCSVQTNEGPGNFQRFDPFMRMGHFGLADSVDGDGRRDFGPAGNVMVPDNGDFATVPFTSESASRTTPIQTPAVLMDVPFAVAQPPVIKDVTTDQSLSPKGDLLDYVRPPNMDRVTDQPLVGIRHGFNAIVSDNVASLVTEQSLPVPTLWGNIAVGTSLSPTGPLTNQMVPDVANVVIDGVLGGVQGVPVGAEPAEFAAQPVTGKLVQPAGDPATNEEHWLALLGIDCQGWLNLSWEGRRQAILNAAASSGAAYSDREVAQVMAGVTDHCQQFFAIAPIDPMRVGIAPAGAISEGASSALKIGSIALAGLVTGFTAAWGFKKYKASR